MFYVGQKVVCVDDRPCRCCGYSQPGFVNGGIYTIASVDAEGSVDLVEHPVALPHTAYDPRRLRPAVERKTDISIFTAMLAPKKKKVSA